MKAAARRAVLKRIGYFYATDGEMPNPWDRLPPYWEEEVEAVKRLNAGKDP